MLKVNVTVGKPKNNIYFRCHPTLSFDKGLIVVGPDGSDDFYYVHPAMKEHHSLKPRIREVIIAVVYAGRTASSRCGRSTRGLRLYKCWKTAYEAYERSKTEWVQMIWNDARAITTRRRRKTSALSHSGRKISISEPVEARIRRQDHRPIRSIHMSVSFAGFPTSFDCFTRSGSGTSSFGRAG